MQKKLEQPEHEVDLQSLAGQAARESESRFRAFVEHAPVAIGMFLNGVCVYVNRKFVELLGLRSADEAIGRAAFEHVAPECREESKERSRRRALGLPVPAEYESIALRADGSRFPVHLALAPIELTDGMGSIALLTDITERKMAEQTLRASEEKYHDLFRHSAIGIFHSTLDGRFLDVNPALARMLGYDDPEAVVSGITNIAEQVYAIPPKRDANAAFAQQSGGFATSDNCYRRRDGSLWYGRLHLRIVHDLQGAPSHYEGFIEDITEQRRADEALQESEKRYRLLFDSSPDGIVLIGTDGRIVSANIVQGRMYRYDSPLELVGMHATRLVAAASREFSMEIMRRRLKGEDVGPVEYEVIRRDGTTFYAEISAKVLWNADGTVAGYICITRDISERKDAERALRKSEAQFREVLDNSTVASYKRNLQTNAYDYLSPVFARMSGYASDELAAAAIESILCFMHPDDLPEIKRVLDQALSGTSGQAYELEYRFKHKDGLYRWFLDRFTVMRDEGGQPLAVIGSVSDITERKRADQEKILLERQLQQAQKLESVGRLAGGVAHDFNNMLAGILGHTESALDERGLTSSVQADLMEIKKCAKRSADLTRQLMAFARQQTIVPIVLDLNETVESMLKLLRRLVGENVALNWHPAAQTWPVKMDPSQIDQILANLCVNARDAIADVGEITISTANCLMDDVASAEHVGCDPGEYVRLVVSDNGCGMDPETLTHVFEPFFTTKDVGEGTGLGLSTVFGAVKQNDGTIQVSSQLGRGTTFTIYLPRYLGKVEPAHSPEFSQPEVVGSETILIAEDELVMLKLAARILKRLGYTVLAASTPGEAIQIAQAYSGTIQLLMTDVVMPEMSGHQLALHLRSRYPKLKCLFMSGYPAEIIDRHGALNEGVHFIQKPFSRECLAAKLREVLESD